MSTSKDPYLVFNTIKKGLYRVNDSISPNSVRTRQDQIDILKEWNDAQWNVLYHDRSDLQYDNSINVLERELQENQQYLRHNGLDLLSYRQELSQFLNSCLIPLQTFAQQLIIVVEEEIEISCNRMPTEPVGFDSIIEGVKCISFYPDQHECYQQRYVVWEKAHFESVGYHSELRSLDTNLNVIRQTIEKYTLSNPPANQKQNNEKTERSDNTERKARQAVSSFESIVEEIVKRENGKYKPLTDNDIVKQAIDKYKQTAIGKNLATTEKGLNRYLKDLGKNKTALQYGGQLVRQLRHPKLLTTK